MFKHKYHVTLTAVALMTLAACGSGQDSDGSSPPPPGLQGSSAVLKADAPQANTGTAAENQSDATAPEATADTAAGTASAGNDAASASGDAAPAGDDAAATAAASALAAASPAAAAALGNNPVATAQAADTSPVVSAPEGAEAAAASVPPISHEGVRGDVILSMLDQRTCDRQRHATGPETGVAGKGSYPSISTTNWVDPDNYRKIAGHALGDTSALCDPSYYEYKALAAGTYTVKEEERIDWLAHHYLGGKSEYRFNEWGAKIPLTVTADGFSLGAQVEGSAKVDTHNGKGKPATGSALNLKLVSDKPFATRSGVRVSYGQLSSWKDAAGHNYQLLLLPGNTGEAKLCWNTNNETVKRLSCTTWKAPEGWHRGQRLTQTNHYVVDDRTTYGETGLIYFSSRAR